MASSHRAYKQQLFMELPMTQCQMKLSQVPILMASQRSDSTGFP